MSQDPEDQSPSSRAEYYRKYRAENPHLRERDNERKRKALQDPKKLQAKREAQRKYNARVRRDRRKETEQARLRRLEERADDPDFKPRGPYTGLGDWCNPEFTKAYYQAKSKERYNANKERGRRIAREYYKNNKDKILAKNKEKRKARAEARGREYSPWGRSPEEKVASMQRKWGEGNYSHELQTYARLAVRIGLLQGTIKRGKCAMRDRDECWGQVQGHHWKGYAEENWTNVIWLCNRHHKMEEHNPFENFLPFEEDTEFQPNLNSAWASWTDPDHKRCSKCGEAKTPDQFYPSKTASDKLTHRCRKCQNKATVASRNKRLAMA